MVSTVTAVLPASTASASKSSGKPLKSKMVTFRLPSKLLSKFPSDVPSTKQERPKSSSTSSPSPSDPASNSPQAAAPSPAADPTNSNATPIPQVPANSSLLAPPPNPTVRRKGIPGPKPGMKRNNSQLDVNGVPKPRGKPGPKKKQRVGDLANGVNGAPAPAAPKLGPKANMGAINEKLRALDRSGKPCRKWQKKGFSVKSFTGVVWGVPSWSTWKQFSNADYPGETKSDSSNSSELKGLPDSSAAPSDKSNSGSNVETPNPPVEVASSPAHAPVAETAA